MMALKFGKTFKFDVKTWYHIIYTCDTKADKLSLYINGKWIQDGKSGKTPQNMDERRVSSKHDGRFLHGIVDEFRIYNRILNEKEALQNFKATNNSIVVEASDKLAVIWACIKSAR